MTNEESAELAVLIGRYTEAVRMEAMLVERSLHQPVEFVHMERAHDQVATLRSEVAAYITK